MKQNSTNSETLTKQEFLETIKELKVDIRTEIRTLEIKMETKMDVMEFRIEDRAMERHSKVLTRFDSWAGSLEKAEIDREIGTDKIIKLREDIIDHEKRIKKLEKIQN